MGQYKPLFIIVGLIALGAIAPHASAEPLPWREVMINFMAGFFLVFSGFKLLDVPGFARGYAKYDLLAQRIYTYGYIYPFVELALGLAYLTRWNLELTNKITLMLMIFSGAGVAMSMIKKLDLRCACLGTFINVPLTRVTLVEDFGMALMAGAMLL